MAGWRPQIHPVEFRFANPLWRDSTGQTQTSNYFTAEDADVAEKSLNLTTKDTKSTKKTIAQEFNGDHTERKIGEPVFLSVWLPLCHDSLLSQHPPIGGHS